MREGGGSVDHGRYVGRVGALAVALGIGIALGSSPGTAWAEPDASSSSSADSETSSSVDAGTVKTRSGRGTSDSAEGQTTSASSDDDDEIAASQEASPSPSSRHKKADDVEDLPTEVQSEVDEPEEMAAPEQDATEITVDTEPAATPVTTAEPAADVAVTTDAAPKVTQRVLTTAVDTSPAAPPQHPGDATLLWSLLGAARRPVDSEQSSFVAAVPNTAPTLTSTYAGKPSSSTSRITGRVRVTDSDGDKLTFTVLAPEKGAATVDSRGNFTYTPTVAFRHSIAGIPNTVFFDRVTIIASDGNGGSVTAYFDLPVRPLNARPSAKATIGKANPATGAVTGKITASDRDGDVVTYSTPATTARGSVVVGSDGSFVYTPTPEARAAATSLSKRSDRFTVTVNDGHGGIATITVSVKIAPPGSNKAPVARTPGFVLNGFRDSDGLVEGYVEVSDPEGFALTYGIGAGVNPGVGSLAVDATTGRFVFVPTQSAREAAHGTSGEDTVRFTVTASDGSASATVEVTVPISPKAPAATNTLESGQWLEVGKYLQSNNGRFRLYMQGDGNLVLYDEAQNHKALWASGTNGKPGARAAMQGDGNLVVYSGSTGVWSTKTNGWNSARVVIQDDGNMVVYAGSTAVWDRHAGVLRNPPSSGGNFAQKVASFVSNTYGKTVANAAGTFAGECVSLVSQFLLQVHGITSGAWGNAVDYRSGGSGGAQLAARGFVWRNDQSFQNGDILVWGAGTYTSGYGHIGIWYNGKSFDQNSGWHRDVGVRQSGYSQFWSQGYLGYWRKP